MKFYPIEPGEKSCRTCIHGENSNKMPTDGSWFRYHCLKRIHLDYRVSRRCIKWYEKAPWYKDITAENREALHWFNNKRNTDIITVEVSDDIGWFDGIEVKMKVEHIRCMKRIGTLDDKSFNCVYFNEVLKIIDNEWFNSLKTS